MRLSLEEINPKHKVTLLEYLKKASKTKSQWFVQLPKKALLKWDKAFEEIIELNGISRAGWGRQIQRYFVIVDYDEGNIVGSIICQYSLGGSDNCDLDGPIEIMVEIEPAYHRQGIAYEMLQEALKLPLFKNSRFYAKIDPKNIPSQELFKKLGFNAEGYLNN